jgi:predicted RNA-binding protein YlqC (UPF0109 family)
MVVGFVTEFAKLLAYEPEKVKVEVVPHEDFDEIVIYAKKADVGRIIGKEGSMVKAIKTVISGCRAKENKNYKITVKSEDE